MELWKKIFCCELFLDSRSCHLKKKFRYKIFEFCAHPLGVGNGALWRIDQSYSSINNLTNQNSLFLIGPIKLRRLFFQGNFADIRQNLKLFDWLIFCF